MKLNNVSEGLTYLLRERHWSWCSEGGVPLSQTRMSMWLRHRIGGKDNVLKTQISFLMLRQVGAPGVQADWGHETGCKGQIMRWRRRQN